MRFEATVFDNATATALGAGGSSLARADLLYCLARAFLPPPPHWTVLDWALPLADDLAAIGEELGIDTRPAREALQAECRRAGATADLWLVEYTRLFLTPPVSVPLNTGLYLEGAIGGMSAQMMHQCYLTAGVEPDDAFHDLPDHVAMQLEFIARLRERAARGEPDAAAMASEFVHEFVDAWTTPLERACLAAECETPAARVYAALTRLLPAASAERGASPDARA